MARLIVVSPRRSRSAKHVDIWFQIRSGTDGVPALGTLNIIANEEFYNNFLFDEYPDRFHALPKVVDAPEGCLEDVKDVVMIPFPFLRSLLKAHRLCRNWWMGIHSYL